MKKNLILGQSGGPTAVINCSLYGAVQEGFRKEEIDKVYGMVNGIEGFLRGDYLDFQEMKDNGSVEKLLYTPGAFLGSCRYKLPEDLSDPVYDEILKKLEEMNIGYFCYIGGNDSMDTVSKLSRYAAGTDTSIRFIGIPKTVDNDLVLTDHTPGFGSAARYVAYTVKEIAYDLSVYNAKSVTIVEIMGRHAGWLTAASRLARETENGNPYLIYLPEAAFDVETFVAQVEKALEVCPNLMVCVSEGIKDKDGVFICEYDSKAGVDSFGHKMLTGCGKYLERLIQDRLKIKARSVELNVCQRCSAMMMSKTDQTEAASAGAFGVNAAVNGETGKMAAFVRKEGGVYEMECTLQDVNLICNEEKTVPTDWIIKDGTDVSEEFVAYALPLIQGKVEVPENENGLADFVKRAGK
ncbi:MAG: 6-phosphofructokinase [Lachnospiraceae bacterium]|nr:6-phosphofructokinase [Lachnospiraceae bacterium]